MSLPSNGAKPLGADNTTDSSVMSDARSQISVIGRVDCTAASFFSLGNKKPRLVSIHAESTGVTDVFEVHSVLEDSGAGRGPMSAATAGSVCLSEKRLVFSALVVSTAANLFSSRCPLARETSADRQVHLRMGRV